MKPQLLIATRSAGKFPEITNSLSSLPFEFINLNHFFGLGFDGNLEAKENGQTFEGNAIIKAMTFGNKFKMLTLADDSGLEVDALDGRPGVYSSRYAPTDPERITKLLKELEWVEVGQRTARFIAVIALYNPFSEEVFTFRGTCEGFIATEPKGDKGFGYDPVFFYPPLNKTLAEISSEEKNKISHRGQALKQVVDFLKSKY